MTTLGLFFVGTTDWIVFFFMGENNSKTFKNCYVMRPDSPPLKRMKIKKRCKVTRIVKATKLEGH